MLTTLNLKDFVIIEQLSLDLAEGFTVLTGETGAGKSILIDAIELVRGARGDSGLVRTGAERANIVAEFSLTDEARRWLQENALLEDGAENALVRRTIDRSGRSRAWINGISVTLSQLRELGDTLVDIQGQHAHQLLLKPACQMRLLDAYAEDAAELEAVRLAHVAWSARAKRLEEAAASAEVRRTRIEQIEWILEDLDALSPKKGEWEALNEEHSRLAHAASIEEGLNESIEWLTQGENAAADLVSKAQMRLDSLSEYDPRLANVSETLTTAAELISDAAGDLEIILDRTDSNGLRFEKVDRRVSKYFNLARKYRTEPELLHEMQAENRKRLAELQDEENLDQLKQDEAAARAEYDKAAQALSEKRRAAAELSRISLAIFTLASRNTTVPTLVFDEVDSGVGGATGEVVGRMMRQLGESRQVFCITHLPQVAACGNRHLKVEKITDGLETVSYLKELNGKARVDEIARMLGGMLITKKAMSLAEEMLVR